MLGQLGTFLEHNVNRRINMTNLETRTKNVVRSPFHGKTENKIGEKSNNNKPHYLVLIVKI